MDEPAVDRDVTSGTATDELTARVAANRAEIDLLEARAGGVVMASRRINEDEASDQLVTASNDTKRTLLANAADVVRPRDLSALPSA